MKCINCNNRKGKAAKAKGSDDEEWGSGDSDEDKSDDEEEAGLKKYLQSNDPMVRRNYWLKRDEPEKEEKDVVKRVREIKEKKVRTYEEDEKKAGPKDYTLDELDKKIMEIVERRAGRKSSTKEKKVSIEDDLETLQSFYDKVEGNDIKRLEVM